MKPIYSSALQVRLKPIYRVWICVLQFENNAVNQSKGINILRQDIFIKSFPIRFTSERSAIMDNI